MKKERFPGGDTPAPVDASSSSARSSPLRIAVAGAQGTEAQAIAYAEYRMFESLAPVPGVRSARVALRRISGQVPAVACSVCVARTDGTTLRFRLTGAHTYQAINKATERLRTLLAEGGRPPARHRLAD